MQDIAKSALLIATLAAPMAAQAGTVVVCPPIAEGLDSKATIGVHQLIAAELDFMPEFDGVSELEARPQSLTNSCLSSTSCLKTITTAGGGDHLVTGKVRAQGNDYVFDLILYDKASNTIVRRVSRTSPSDPSELANNMTPIIREVATGEGPDQAAAAPAVASFETEDDEEDFDFDEGEELPDDMDAMAAEQERQRAEAAAAAAAAAAARASTSSCGVRRRAGEGKFALTECITSAQVTGGRAFMPRGVVAGVVAGVKRAERRPSSAPLPSASAWPSSGRSSLSAS